MIQRIQLFCLLFCVIVMSSCSSRRPDVDIVQYGDVNYIVDVVEFRGAVWCATKGGLLKWELESERYTSITTADGLPSNVLTSVVNQSDDKLWIGTANGLAVFDGEYLTLYDTADGLPSDEITQLEIDSKGLLYVGTVDGLAVFNGGSFEVIDDPDGPGRQLIKTVMVDSGNNLWAGTDIDGVYLRTTTGWQKTTSKDGLVSNGSDKLAQAWDRSVWSAGWAGITRWDGLSWRTFSSNKIFGTFYARDMDTSEKRFWYFTDIGVHVSQGSEWFAYTEDNGLISNDTLCGLAVSDTRSYVGTADGLSVIDDGTIKNYTINNMPFGYNFISVAADERGRLWIGSWETGLNFYDSGFWTKLRGGADTLLDTVREVVFGPADEVAFMTSTGVILKKGTEWLDYDRRSGIAGNDVRCGVFDAEGDLWIGTETGVSRLKNNRWTRYREIHGLPSEDIWACTIDAEGGIWFGTTKGIASITNDGITNHTSGTGSNDADVRSAIADGTALLFGTENGRLLQYANGAWDEFGNNWTGTTFGIHSILRAPDGALWLGTNGGGLVKILDGSRTVYTRADGLPSNYVRDLAWSDGTLWVACFGGIAVVSPKTGTAK